MNKLIESTTIPKGKVFYAEIEGRVFKNSTGHAFFWRKCDLVRSLKQSNIRTVVREAAEQYYYALDPERYRKLTYEERVKAIDVFWDSYVGEGRRYPCQIKSIELS